MSIYLFPCLFAASVKVFDIIGQHNLSLKLARLNMNLFRNAWCLKFLL